MSGRIVDLSDGRGHDRTTDVCIVGSGCAGATAARVLAEAGVDVVVLEEGGDRTGRALTQRDAEMYGALYADRGGRSTEDLAITVLQGRALGGGGVINAADVVPIPDAVLEHWGRRFGLSDLSPEALAPHRAAALADLGARPIAEEQLNEANRLLREGARALGLRGEIMMHNRVGCAGLGTCLIGCPLDAKRNPRFVAVPAALAAGADFLLRVRAVRVEDATAEIKTVVCRTLDPAGHRERGELRVRARRVIVAGSAIATPQLLLRSGIGNQHVGRGLMLQPQLPIVAVFDRPIHAFRGIPQAFAITEHERDDDPEHGLWGFRIEAIMGTPGIVSTLLPFVGREGPRTMAGYDRIAAALLLVPDAPSGEVALRASGRPRIAYTMRDDVVRRMRHAAREAARIYLAAGAREVLVPVVPPVIVRSERDLDALDRMDLRPASAPILSAHQQGTVRFGTSEREGAADPEGRVYGARDVLAFDSSLFPSSASSHTMAPIITVARHLSERLLAS